MTTSTATPFKVGDWVFCEFQLSQIDEIEDGRVTNISTGYIEMGSNDLNDRCFPLTKDMLRISGEFEFASKRIHREGHAGLNYPDIKRWMVDHWAATCRHVDDVSAVKRDYERLHEFVNAMLKPIGDSGYGFPLVRPR